jgi:glucosamine-6-phosphate deaminase
MSVTPVRVLPTPEAIGESVAGRLLDRIDATRASGRRFLLGCPTGRTPRPVFSALARLLALGDHDASHLVLVMMDEYLVSGDGGLVNAGSHHPWSCHHFAREEIVGQLNARLSPAHRIRDEATWFPDPRDPAAYETRITDAGGIDFFMLASGAGDGHVAFNPPGSARDSRTRIIPLSEQTRRDNLATFPTFGTLESVPRHGISVGIETIASAREAAMIVWGAGKRTTLKRMLRAKRYEPDWPATIIHECAIREIVCDSTAMAADDGAEPPKDSR